MGHRLARRITTGVIGRGAATVTYTISGTVYDADGSTAVASATVALGALTATSGADGTYTISGVAAGASGSMTCTKSGYSWTAITVAAMAANLTSQNYTNAWWATGGIAAMGVGAYRAKGAASYAASKVNFVTPGTKDLVKVNNDPTWDTSTGWSFVGASSQDLTTGINASGTTTLIVRVAGISGNSGAVCGLASTQQKLRIFPTFAGTLYYSYSSTAEPANTAGAGVTSGVICLTPAAIYVDGTKREDAATSAPDAEAIIIGRDGTDKYTGSVLAFAVYNGTLNATQVAALSSVIANF